MIEWLLADEIGIKVIESQYSASFFKILIRLSTLIIVALMTAILSDSCMIGRPVLLLHLILEVVSPVILISRMGMNVKNLVNTLDEAEAAFDRAMEERLELEMQIEEQERLLALQAVDEEIDNQEVMTNLITKRRALID